VCSEANQYPSFLEVAIGFDRRPSDYELDAPHRPGRLQTDLACSRWMPCRSRWL